MTVVDQKSAEITNLDASPTVKNTVFNSGSRLRRYFATVAIGVGDIGGVIRMIRIRGSDILHRVEYASDDENASLTLDFGLWDVGANAIEDVNFFADDLATGAGAKARTDVSAPFQAVAIEDMGKQVWEQLSLTDTPANREKLFDICFTTAGAATTGSDVSVWVELARQE